MEPRRTPVRVGIIGAGNVLPAYLQVLDRLIPRGEALEGLICARSADRWPALRERRPSMQLVSNPQDVVQSDCDVVAVITAPDTHASIVQLALEHGKHVIAEKPLAATRSEAECLAAVARGKDLHLMAAPFVQLAPTFRALWVQVHDGAIGKPHSARGLYGNAGSTWARWYHEGNVGPLAEVGIYNLKSLTALLGPVSEVLAAEARAFDRRSIAGVEIREPNADVSHVILRHVSGALSSVVASHAMQRYRRPALEVYGTEGTANLLGDDWDPRGFEIWRNEAGRWEEYEAIDPTWNWADGLREMVLALRQARPPLADLDHDLHLLDVIEAAETAVREHCAVPVTSRFGPLNLRFEGPGARTDVHHLHDHTRPADEQ